MYDTVMQFGSACLHIDDYTAKKGAYHARLEEGDVYASLSLQNESYGGYFGLHQEIGRLSTIGAMGKRQEARANELLRRLLPHVLVKMKQAGWVEERPLLWKKAY